MPRLQGLFRILPPILFIYFLPGVGSLLGVTPMLAVAIASAARTSARCENAWGKLPTMRLPATSYSSESSPRSVRTDSTRSNSARASSRRPMSARLSTNQNVVSEQPVRDILFDLHYVERD